MCPRLSAGPGGCIAKAISKASGTGIAEEVQPKWPNNNILTWLQCAPTISMFVVFLHHNNDKCFITCRWGMRWLGMFGDDTMTSMAQSTKPLRRSVDNVSIKHTLQVTLTLGSLFGLRYANDSYFPVVCLIWGISAFSGVVCLRIY